MCCCPFGARCLPGIQAAVRNGKPKVQWYFEIGTSPHAYQN